MTVAGSTITRATAEAITSRSVDLVAPVPLADISCWRLLTARVPLTLLLDLAAPSAEVLAEQYDEMLAEPSSIDWIPAPRRSHD